MAKDSVDMGSSPVRARSINEKVVEDSRLDLDEDSISPGRESREQASRLTDDLQLLRAERLVSHQEHEKKERSKSRRRGGGGIPEDAFNQQTEQPPQPPGKPASNTLANKLWKKLKKFPRVIRYVVYMAPGGVVLLAPILIDIYAVPGKNVPVGGPGGVRLLWFGIWLECVWCSLWVSRIICSVMPYLFKWCAKAVGSSNHKKWKDIGYGLELSTALFLWMLAVLCSFLPTVNSHRDETSGEWQGNDPPYIQWIDIVNKVIVGFFVLFTLNIVEKILIQWIASSFHLRTYAYRIEANKRDIQYLVQLFEFARSQTQEGVWDMHASAQASGSKTPLQTLQANAKEVWSRFGTVATRMAGDFTGRKVMHQNHPRKVVIELLRATPTSHTLARMIFRSLCVTLERQTLVLEDFQRAIPGPPEEAEACFGVFDRDLNGDVSMEELELATNEIHLEKKAIAASLKDLDSVIGKLDRVFLVVIVFISIIVFVAIISSSAAAALASAGSAVLGLAWMLQATAQEFLQSMIFVFVKHPFDVGDRVRVYGNTGSMMTGDDYYVQEISLLYTEFKKMEGHVVQAPNSLLNNLFILNMRRSNGLADPIELKMRFGTRNEVIEELKARMLDFVMEHKRDYAPRIITEVKTIDEVYSVTINFIFFHKSSFQNELLRLQRHNKFAAELMRQMTELGIEGPRKQQPGGTMELPFYWTQVTSPPAYTTAGGIPPPPPHAPTNPSYPGPSGHSGRPTGLRLDTINSAPASPTTSTTYAPTQANPPPHNQQQQQIPPQSAVSSATGSQTASSFPAPSAELRRRRAESRAAAQAAMDAAPDFQDVYDSRRPDAVARLHSIRAAAQAQAESASLPCVASNNSAASAAASVSALGQVGGGVGPGPGPGAGPGVGAGGGVGVPLPVPGSIERAPTRGSIGTHRGLFSRSRTMRGTSPSGAGGGSIRGVSPYQPPPPPPRSASATAAPASTSAGAAAGTAAVDVNASGNTSANAAERMV